MPYLVEYSIRHSPCIASYDPPVEGQMSARIALGYELAPEQRAQLPKRVHVCRGPTRTLTFVYGMLSGPFIFPPAAHDILMELEPEGHLFHELEAVADDVSLGPYFLQLQSPVVDCVDVDETVYGNGRGRDYFEEVMARTKGPIGGPPTISVRTAQRISLLRSEVAGRHWWRAPRRFCHALFCSPELRKRFQAARIAGLEYERCHLSGAEWMQ